MPDLVELMARAMHQSADKRSQGVFRVAWQDCLPAYREMLLSDARMALHAIEGAGYVITADPSPEALLRRSLLEAGKGE